MNEFKIWVAENSIKDIITSTKLLCECLIGNMTLQDYRINSDFEVFAKKFEESVLNLDSLNNFTAKKTNQH